MILVGNSRLQAGMTGLQALDAGLQGHESSCCGSMSPQRHAGRRSIVPRPARVEVNAPFGGISMGFSDAPLGAARQATAAPWRGESVPKAPFRAAGHPSPGTPTSGRPPLAPGLLLLD